MKLLRESFWKKSCKAKIPNYPRLVGKGPSVDVCVVGSGMTGLQSALKLAEAGKKVALVEADGICQGVTCHTTGKVSSFHHYCYANMESKFNKTITKHYAEMNEAGVNLVRDFIKRYNIECDWQDRPNYTFTTSEDEVEMLKNEAEAAIRAGLQAKFTTTDTDLPYPLRGTVKGAVKVENQGQFNAYSYGIGLVKALEKQGVHIYENSRVVDVGYTAPHTVQTEEGNIEAENVIVATHLPILDRSMHFGVTTPKRSYCIAVTLKDESKMFKGMYISMEKDFDDFGSKSLRSADNDRVLIIAGNGHPVGESKPTKSEEDHYQNLVQFAMDNFPVKDIICSWSSHDYYTADNLPYIGYLHHGTSTLFTATGFKKWGLSTSAGSAIIISDLILGKDNEWAKTFDARRWDLTKSTLGMVQFNLHVTKNFIGDRIKDAVAAEDIENLTNGKGGICKYGLETVAAYKDDNGTLRIFSPTCTHLGCRLAFNEAEKSFDCTCHGSRFSAMDGAVLHGPAIKDLPIIERSKL